MSGEMIKGARIVLETLHRLGVTDMFGYPGGAVIPIFDEIYSFPEIKHYFVRHEQGAAHAADGYARATGKVGVCLATSGPGATNLVTGIYTAHMDSVPMLAITGQVGTGLIGKDSFQEVDISGITMPITKHNYLVQDIRDLPHVLKEAYYIAGSGRPGPVLVDIPKNIQCQSLTMSEFNKLFEAPVSLEGYDPTYKGHQGQIKKAVSMIKSAKKPLIIAGAGVLKSNAMAELKTLAETVNIPVTNTLLGLGSFPGDHELSLGMLGMHGTVAANFATEEADLVIAAGIRFDDRITGDVDHFCPKAKIIHIDIDPAEIDKNITINIPIVGDLKQVLTEINDFIEPADHDKWLAQIAEWKSEYPMVVPEGDGTTMMPQYVLSKLNEYADEDAIIVTDVGQHQMWAAQYLTYNHPNTILSSGGAGTMGYGVPAAMGAQVGQAKRQVILVVGDGGFQMTMEELMMMKQYNLPVKILIVNNAFLGMVRQWQEIFNDRRYSFVDLEVSPNFIKIAEAYDLPAVRLDSQAEFDAQFKDLIQSDTGVVIDCRVSRETNVFPMIPAGEPVKNMMGLKGVLENE